MTLIEAAKQAMEALEEAHPKPYNESVISHVEAITALRTAIEQVEKQDPVAWRTCVGGIWFTAGKKEILQKELESIDSAAKIEPLYTTPPAAPVQEPVALENVYETIIHWDEGGGKRSRRELARRIVALYTIPPAAQHQPLTDEQILNVARDHYNPHQRPEISFARVIEQAHGIK